MSQKCAKIGRSIDCFDEHILGEDENISCREYVPCQPFSRDGQVNLYQQRRKS